ncbi:autotransporter outer membrane beta-barrel domain-containing protein [Synechococcus sp. CC9902]|uniref:autotransporter outer membrane beta-barrel domain-containing protein n=1 Tax=Synechococcus sp. (strain CC9902) TaxID=316279 RepID=UPI0012E9E7C8|nr:autotransporter outer membrane beta-barrel domain-containing protein [Synechococcus sp. CC9902]
MVFALLCGDWAEPAKARAAVGGHKALSKLLPASSNASTTDVLLAQAPKPKNFPDDQKIPLPGPDTKDKVTLWQLPEDFKSVIATDSGDFYGIYYSAWNREREDVQLPGVYGSGWIDGSKNNNYQPWKDDEDLAEELSVKYLAQKQSFMVECDSSKDYQTGCVDEVNGEKVKNLNLYGFWNGGGFAYGAIKPDQSVSRPSGGNSPKIGYYWNGELYQTNGGDNYKIQFFAGCNLNTINSSVSDSGLSSPEDCKNGTAPVLDGGSLNFDTKQEYSSSLYVTSKGGTIDNNGRNLILDGTIQSIGDTSDSPSSLFFDGEGSTSLQGNNSYLNPTTVKEGVLEITNVDGLGSADAGTRVEESAVLRISVSGVQTPEGQGAINDAKINEEITLAGGEIDLNGNYIDLKGGVVLEGDGVNSTIRVKGGSTEVFARSIISGDGGLIKDGEGFFRLGGGGPQTYNGETIIKAGELRFADSTSTPKTTHVTVKEGATLRLVGENEVSSIEGSGRIFLQNDGSALTVNVEDESNPDFEGSIRDPRDDLEGTFIKDGGGSLTLTGKNAYGSLIVEKGQLDINGENIDTEDMDPSEASVSLSLGKDLSVKGGTALRVTGRDVDETYGPRTPPRKDGIGNTSTSNKLAPHASPILEFDDSINELTVENGSLLVASFIGALPTDYEAYKDNCKIGADPKTCYSIRPQILFKGGEDTLTNNGLIVGPGEAGTGNHLQLRFEGGNDTLNNGLSEGNDRRSGSWLGCVTAGADDQGFNGYKYGNTCDVANEETGGNLPDANSKDAKRNYTVNVYMGAGNDAFTNHQGSYLRGNFYGEGGDDVFGSQGVIRGNIVMGKGSDTVTFQGGGAENKGQLRGIGVLDDRLALGTAIKIENDNSLDTDVNKLNLFGNAVVSYRNSLGWGVKEDLENCGGRKSTTGRSDYGCRWDDGGYGYAAIVGSKGKDSIWVKKKSDGTQPVAIWGSVELGASNDALRLGNTQDKFGGDLHLIGDLDLGSGNSQIISIDKNSDFSVRAIRGDNIDFQIYGLATLGGDSELGVFAADRDVDLKQGNTLSSYTGTTTINEGGTLRAGQAWSLSSESIHQVDGKLILGDNDNRREDQEIGELTGKGLVSLQNQSYLFYGGLNGDVEFSGTSKGDGALVKKGSGTTTFSGTFGHTGFTKVHDGTLLLQEDESLSEKSTVLISSSTKQPTLDLGDTTQRAPKYNLHGGTLRNGTLGAAEINVERRTNNAIDSIEGELVSVNVSSRNDFEEEVGLTFSGSNQFKSLQIDRATVLIDESANVELSGDILGGDFVSRGAAFELSDKLDIQGSLTVGGSIDLDAGNDLIRIGNLASVSSGVIDGGSGDFDVFWNQNASLDFDTSNVKGFEIISYKGEGLAYLGDKASLIVTAADRDIDDSLYTEYGLIVSTPSNNTLDFSSNSNAKNIESGITVGLLQLDGDSTIHLRQGSLDIAALQSNAKGKRNKFILGAPLELSSEAPLQSLRESLVSPGSGVDLDQVASGRLSVGASDQSIASIDQQGGLWSYEGDFSSTSLSGQGVVVVGDGNDDSESSATFKSLTADGSRRLLIGARKDGVLSVTNGIHDSWSPDLGFLNVSKASLISNGDVVLGISGGDNPSTYKGLTVVMQDGSIKTLENDAIGPQSPTLVRGLLQIGESEGSGVSQNFARRLIVGETGSIQNGDLSVTSLANAGDVQIDSLTVNNGMKRLLDVLDEKGRRPIPVDSPLRKIKAQGSLKNLGGNIEISGDLKYQDNQDASAGHALFNIGRPRLRKQPGLLQANRIFMGPKNDLIFNSGIIATTTDEKTSIDLGGGNDLILNRGTFEIGSSIIDGGEPLEITGSILTREARSATGLNIFRGSGTEDPGVDENQLVNFAAIKLTADGDWIFPQGNDCRVTGVGRTFSKSKLDCVGIVGQRNADQFLQITDGAIVKTGVMELGRSSDNRIEVLDGTLEAGLIDGVVGSARINRYSGEIVFDRSVNASFNSLIVGDESSTASLKAKAIHNISSIHVVNGSLDTDLLHAKDLEDLGQVPELKIGATIDSSLLSTGSPKSLIEQISDNAVKGTLRVDETEGYSKAQQLGGMWGYEGDFSDIDLSAQGIVTTTKSSDDFSIKDDANEDLQEDIDEVTFKSITALGNRRLLVGAREGGKLTITDGLHETETSNKAAILNNGELVLGTSDRKVPQSSTYSGATVVMKDGHIQTLNADAIGPESPTLVRGRLSIGDETTGVIEQNFAKLLIVGKGGIAENGALSVTSLTNAGDVQIDSLTVNNGMKRLLDVLDEKGRRPIPVDSPLRKIKAQGSLKNLGGTIEITGDLKYQDNEDATAGHALINIRNLRDVTQYNQKGGLKPQPGTLVANSIFMGSNNDVILNSGIIATTTRQSTSINLGGGNDLILNRGTFEIGSSIIDGGEPLNTTGSILNPDARSVTGLNIFRQGLDPYRGLSDQASGLEEFQLVNFAAIKLEHDGDWIFPQGQDCQVRGESKTFDADKRCVGITGLKKENQTIVIENGARVEAGVVALGRDSTNTIQIEKGSLRAVLIEGGNELLDRIRDKRGLASNNLPTKKEAILLGKEGSDASGELIVGGIVDVEKITQLGGTWAYAVNASEDGFGVFPETTAAGTLAVKEITLNRRSNDSSVVSRATFQKIDGNANDLSVEVDSDASLAVIDGIHGAKTTLSTEGEVRLSGESDYRGVTTIQNGGILYSENNSALSEKSSILIEVGGVLDLQGFDNTISSLSGSGDLVLNPRTSTMQISADEVKGADLEIQAGEFAGIIADGGLSGLGSITKTTDGELILSGVNTYSSPTFVDGGTLVAASSSALSPESDFTLSNNGVLDLSTYPRQARFKADDKNYSAYLKSLTIGDQSSNQFKPRLTVSSLAPLRVKEQLAFDQGEIATFLDSGVESTAPIQIDQAGKFVFREESRNLGPASLYMVVSNEEARQQEGTWNVIDGVVENADELAKNTYLLVPALPGEKKRENKADFVEINGVDYRIAQFDGVDQPLADAALSDVRLEKGSLKLVVEQKSFDGIQEDLNGDEGDVDELPGCENDDELCDVISDIDGEEDQASNAEEDSAAEIIDGVVDGLQDQEIEIPLGFNYGQLAKLVTSGLAPRNVDAAGRGIALFNNQLVDSVFDRHPLRQFEELIAESSATQLNSDLLSETAVVKSDSDDVLSSDIGIVEADGVSYVDLENDSLDLSSRDGVSAWMKGFGGNSRADNSSILYNDYDLSSYGTSFGVDIALSDSFQIGAYANYGDVRIQHSSDDTGGGSWDSDGWGGGLTAQYSTRNFYVQGLLGASEFSGEQTRNILQINQDFGANTAKGDKKVTSYLGALRMGAPFKVGGVVLEPQAQAVWTQNREDGFSETSGTEKNLRLKYKDRATNFLETELGMKVSMPIRTGDRSLLVPSLRAAWLADWNQNNEAQQIGYKFTNQTVDFDSQLETQNGALIEAGLDYTIQNFNRTSLKVYARGGAEVWGGDRGTTWRGSGGVTFQF